MVESQRQERQCVVSADVHRRRVISSDKLTRSRNAHGAACARFVVSPPRSLRNRSFASFGTTDAASERVLSAMLERPRRRSGVFLVRVGFFLIGVLCGCGRLGFEEPRFEDGSLGSVDAFLRLDDAGSGGGDGPTDAGRLEDARVGSGRLDAGDGVDSGFATDAGGSDAGGSGTDAAGAIDAGIRARVPGPVVLYLFDEGSGDVVFDQGPAPRADLTIVPPSAVTWRSSGLTIDAAARIAYPPAATKLVDACQATGEITVEAWVTPADAVQRGPARIVTLTRDKQDHNFMLGQQGDFYQARLRTTDTDALGDPTVSSLVGTGTTALTHVVFVRGAANPNLRIFVNGSFTGADPRSGTFDTWDPAHRLVLGNDLTDDKAWLGTLHLVAVYDRALDPAEIQQNYEAGPN